MWEVPALPQLHPSPMCLPPVPCLSSQAYTRSLAYDPEGAYLASVNADGTLNVWQIEDGKSQLCRRKACPKVGGRAGGWQAEPG